MDSTIESNNTDTNTFPDLGPEISIKEKLGSGASGTVYRATQILTNRTVALKLFNFNLDSNNNIERFKQEALALSKINNKNVVKILSMGISPSKQFYLIMEFVEGESLDKILARETSLPELKAAKIAFAISQGLEAAHQENIIHRDIKPANIIVQSDESAKIVDFSISKLQSNMSVKLTATGACIGTLSYMAPELLKGKAPDNKVDLYSLGAVLYEMITGELLKPKDLGLQIILEASNKLRLTWLNKNKVNNELVSLMYSLLNPDPNKRIDSANKTSLKLKQLIESNKLSERTLKEKKKQNNLFLFSRPSYILISLFLALTVYSWLKINEEPKLYKEIDATGSLAILDTKKKISKNISERHFQAAKQELLSLYNKTRSLDEKFWVCETLEKLPLNVVSENELFILQHNLFEQFQRNKHVSDSLCRKLAQKLMNYYFKNKDYFGTIIMSNYYLDYKSVWTRRENDEAEAYYLNALALNNLGNYKDAIFNLGVSINRKEELINFKNYQYVESMLNAKILRASLYTKTKQNIEAIATLEDAIDIDKFNEAYQGLEHRVDQELELKIKHDSLLQTRLKGVEDLLKLYLNSKMYTEALDQIKIEKKWLKSFSTSYHISLDSYEKELLEIQQQIKKRN